MENKLQLALTLSEEILSGIETESLKLSTVALRCLRLARLLSDEAATQWLQYENSGYLRTPDGYIESNAFAIACNHGREIERSKDDKSQQMFTELADELETAIETSQAFIGTLTTNGVSISSEYATIALRELTSNVTARNNAVYALVKDSRRRLAILRAQYYNYAISINSELKFSQRADEIFQSYRLSVDKILGKLAPESIRRLDATYERLSSDNSESWSQALTSCRRVFQEVADALFDNMKIGERTEPYKTKSGKVLDVSGDNYKNRLFAVIDKISTSKTASNLVGSNILYVVDWVEYIHDVLSKGVHDLKEPLKFEDARQGILHTYIVLGDIATAVNTSNE